MKILTNLNFRMRKQKIKKILNLFTKSKTYHQDISTLKDFCQWMRADSVTLDKKIDLICEVLSENPKLKETLQDKTLQTLTALDPVNFFVEAGIVDSHAFMSELLHRLAHKWLPSYKNKDQLIEWVYSIFTNPNDLTWIENLKPPHLNQIFTLFSVNPNSQNILAEKYKTYLKLANQITLNRVAYLSTLNNFNDRVKIKDRFTIFELCQKADPQLIPETERILTDIYKDLELGGVSIELVFLIEKMRSNLNRHQLLTHVINSTDKTKASLEFMLKIYADIIKNNSLRGLIKTHLKLILKKIVERSGITGEHYIARTITESKKLFWSAAGGGILTVFTTFIKSSITHRALPLFVEGFMAWSNYTLSFIFIQLGHFTLATKTPALTASHLAHQLTLDDQNKQRFIKEVQFIVKSGVTAILGNVIFVFIGAIIFDLVYLSFTDHHVYTPESALHYLEAHHPFESLTLWYAILTGMILWFGSAIGGWFENWYAFRKLNLALIESPLLNLFLSQKYILRFSNWMSHSVLGFATNFALGFMLAFTSVFGKFFGLPLDVRHVTLSTGTMAFSLMGINNYSEHWSLLLMGLISIVFIGFLNFTASFIISLIVATQSRGIKLSHIPKLFKTTN